MAFVTNDRSVYDLLNDKMFIVSPNQRKYVWTKNNWRELLDDMDLVVRHNTDKHFIGSIILKKEVIDDGIKNHYSVIDGQQRISTLTIMLCAMAYIYAESNFRDEFYGLEKQLFVTDNKRNSFPILSDKANKSISALVCSLFMMANKVFEEQAKLDMKELFKVSKSGKAISDCFEFFYSELKSRIRNDMSVLSSYRDVLYEIRYIDIVAEADEDAYTIFEVLNARGLPLTDFELLRNYLLRYASDSQKMKVKDKLVILEELLGSSSEMFLKHYVLHKYGAKTDKNDNRPYKVIANNAKGKISALLEDLLLKAKYYKKMTEYSECSPLEQKVFSFFKPRRQQQFRPLVMGMMHQKELGTLPNDTYEQYLEYLYEFFICYYIIGKQTSNKIEDIVYGYSFKMENQFTDNLLNEFQESMANRIPSRENFINSIKNIRYSHKFKAYSDNRTRENVLAIYELLERELGFEGSFENITVEHCNPDADSENNSHIGNLMLLEKDINEIKCKGKRLAQKVEEYSQSKYKYPKIIKDKFLSRGSLNYEENSDYVAGILYDRIRAVTRE